MIESKTITISMEINCYNVGRLLYGRAYFIWDCASPDKRATIWEEIRKFAEELDDIPDLDRICEIIERH